MRIEERRDKQVIGEGFAQWEKDCQATVYSLPIFISDVAVQKQPALYISRTCGLFHRDRMRVTMDVTFPTNFSVKVTFKFGSKRKLFMSECNVCVF